MNRGREIVDAAAWSGLASAEVRSRLKMPEAVQEFAILEAFESRPGTEKLLRGVRGFVERLGKVPGLYLVGETGAGKTTAGWAVLDAIRKAYLEAYKLAVEQFVADENPSKAWHRAKAELPEWNVRFTTGAEIYNRALPSGDDRERFRMVEELTSFRSSRDVNVLFLDDLERGKPSDFFTAVLHQIVDRRYRDGLAMIVTTNRRPEELVTLVGEGVVRRLLESCLLVEFPPRPRD